MTSQKKQLIQILNKFPTWRDQTLEQKWMPEAVERLADHLMKHNVILLGCDLVVSEEQESELVETMCMEGPNQFKTVSYKPTCPHGYTDCVWDTAYIHATYPNWYKKLCGDTLPEENPCGQCPNGERYDDEDK